jgi:hypothetical protein
LLNDVQVNGFLITSSVYRSSGIPTPAQADALLRPGDIPLLSVTRR